MGTGLWWRVRSGEHEREHERRDKENLIVEVEITCGAGRPGSPNLQ